MAKIVNEKLIYETPAKPLYTVVILGEAKNLEKQEILRRQRWLRMTFWGFQRSLMYLVKAISLNVDSSRGYHIMATSHVHTGAHKGKPQ